MDLHVEVAISAHQTPSGHTLIRVERRRHDKSYTVEQWESGERCLDVAELEHLIARLVEEAGEMFMITPGVQLVLHD